MEIVPELSSPHHPLAGSHQKRNRTISWGAVLRASCLLEGGDLPVAWAVVTTWVAWAVIGQSSETWLCVSERKGWGHLVVPDAPWSRFPGPRDPNTAEDKEGVSVW